MRQNKKKSKSSSFEALVIEKARGTRVEINQRTCPEPVTQLRSLQ